MIERLEKAIARLRSLPKERQEDAAELILSLVEHDSDSLQLTDAQAAEVERRMREPSGFVAHAEVEAFLRSRTA